jgi:CRISPR-associated protein Cmr2
LRKVKSGETVTDRLDIATLPNRFQAEVPRDFDAAKCVKAVKSVWARIAERVWESALAHCAHLGKQSEEIWKRQIENYWEIIWVVGDEPYLLERRKNWRSYVPEIEPGDKCTLMGEHQELSGYIRIREKTKQDKFWESVRKNADELNLAEGERLCSIALIKRFFPLVARDIIWKVPTRYPSTPYLAATTWLAKMCREQPERARHFAAEAQRLAGASRSENPDLYESIKDGLSRNPQTREFASLDGNCYFDSSLNNSKLWAEGTESIRKELTKKLKEFGSQPSSFYAILLMDGDRLGKLLNDNPCNDVSDALTDFSHQVNKIIKKHGGITVYSGGDDVLAFLPVDKAMPAAVKLQLLYKQSFEAKKINNATVSAAIVYSHFNTPLTVINREAHYLLDEVAKEKTGRGSLAVTVWKGSGRALVWAAPWDIFVNGDKNIFEELVESFKSDDSNRKEFNSSFFYNLRSRYEMLKDKGGISLTDGEVTDILAAEYLRNRKRDCSLETAKERVEKLLMVCSRYFRDESGKTNKAQGELSLDGALLIKFLANEEVL